MVYVKVSVGECECVSMCARMRESVCLGVCIFTSMTVCVSVCMCKCESV